MGTAAWVAWVTLVMVVALATTNPFYLAILLLCVVLVALLSPRSGTGVTSFRTLALFGVSMMVISVFVATINGNYGEHVLFTMPGPEVPRWLGGLRLGGPVSAEGLVASGIRGVAILSIFLAFGVFNGAVSPYRVLRSTPAALFHASLVVTVGLSLLPASIEDLRRIREMRALRGASGGIRDLPALVVPAVIGGLERSMRLAEAMEARGYASGSTPPIAVRVLGAASAPLFIAASWLWFYSADNRLFGGLLGVAGCTALAAWLIAASRARNASRLDREPVPLVEALLTWASLAAAVVVVILRLLGEGAFTYNPFAGLPPPRFSLLGASFVLASAWPVLRLLLAPAPRQNDAAATERALAAEAP